MKKIPDITVTLRCGHCRNLQRVTSATAHEDEKHEKHYYFGSRFDFCDKCDGPMYEEKEPVRSPAP